MFKTEIVAVTVEQLAFCNLPAFLKVEQILQLAADTTVCYIESDLGKNLVDSAEVHRLASKCVEPIQLRAGCWRIVFGRHRYPDQLN